MPETTLLRAFDKDGVVVATIRSNGLHCELITPATIPNSGKLQLGFARIVVRPPNDPERWLVLDVLHRSDLKPEPIDNNVPRSGNMLTIVVQTPVGAPPAPPIVNGISFFGVVRSYLPLIAVPIEGSLKIQGGKLEWQNLKVHNTYLNVTTKGLLENAPSVISGKQISTVGNPLFGLLFSSSELGELSFVLATTPAEENPLPLNLRENVVTRSQVDQGSFIVVQMRVKNRLDLADADEADQQLKVGDFLVQLPNELIKRHKLDTTNPPELSQVHNILDSNGRLLPDSNRWIVAIQDLPLIAGLQAYSRLAKLYV
jgi:hypothetical protein